MGLAYRSSRYVENMAISSSIWFTEVFNGPAYLDYEAMIYLTCFVAILQLG